MRQQKIQQANSAVPSKISAINEKEYLAVAETAQLLGMTRLGVYKLIYRGDLLRQWDEIPRSFTSPTFRLYNNEVEASTATYP